MSVALAQNRIKDRIHYFLIAWLRSALSEISALIQLLLSADVAGTCFRLSRTCVMWALGQVLQGHRRMLGVLMAVEQANLRHHVTGGEVANGKVTLPPSAGALVRMPDRMIWGRQGVMWSDAYALYADIDLLKMDKGAMFAFGQERAPGGIFFVTIASVIVFTFYNWKMRAQFSGDSADTPSSINLTSMRREVADVGVSSRARAIWFCERSSKCRISSEKETEAGTRGPTLASAREHTVFQL